MRTFQNCAAQGDFIIQRIEKLPDKVVEIRPEEGHFVLAHSETGHHHVLSAQNARAWRDPNNPLRLFILVVVPEPITHLREWDTHEALMPKEPGLYEVRQQKEFSLKGWRRVQD